MLYTLYNIELYMQGAVHTVRQTIFGQF